MAKSRSKRQRANENETGGDGERDMISSLPDSMLCHILSFLPTETSVATSVLSRRWRHVWEHLQVFEFTLDSQNIYQEYERFALFVNGVLALRKSRDIRTFRLSCGQIYNNFFFTNSVSMWVRAAIGPHLEELCLNIFSDEGIFVPFSTLFTTCTKLVSLHLYGNIHLEIPSLIRLPSLKSLVLSIDTIDSINNLLSGCPILETLSVSFAPEEVTKACVPTSLKMLEFEIENHVGAHLDICTPNLEYLHIILSRTSSFTCSIDNLDNILEAFLDVYVEDESPDTLLKLLRALYRTKYLVLRDSTIQWLLHAPILEFPEFSNLLDLELSLPCSELSFLFYVLHKCPLLQSLTILNEEELPVSRSWMVPTSFPNCLVSHLTYVHYKGYVGSINELAIVTYILQGGLVLRTMMIDTHPIVYMERYDILKKLSEIARGSSLCQLKFD